MSKKPSKSLWDEKRGRFSSLWSLFVLVLGIRIRRFSAQWVVVPTSSRVAKASIIMFSPRDHNPTRSCTAGLRGAGCPLFKVDWTDGKVHLQWCPFVTWLRMLLNSTHPDGLCRVENTILRELSMVPCIGVSSQFSSNYRVRWTGRHISVMDLKVSFWVNGEFNGWMEIVTKKQWNAFP